jgi:hypothetical protein
VLVLEAAGGVDEDVLSFVVVLVVFPTPPFWLAMTWICAPRFFRSARLSGSSWAVAKSKGRLSPTRSAHQIVDP